MVNDTNQQIHAELSRSFDSLFQLIDPLSEEQLNKKPFEGSWTAGQVGDHLRQSYNVISMLQGKTRETERPVLEQQEMLKKVFLDFNTKLKSPEFIIPTNDPINREELTGKLHAKAKKILQFTESEDLSLTCTEFVLPGATEMTRLEWLYFISYHTQRHTHQLKNIVAVLHAEEHA